MNHLQLAAAALNQTPLAWEANKANILAAIAAAREEGVSILCLPELCVTGYGCEDAFHSPGVIRTAHEVLAEIVPATRGLAVAIGVPVCHRGGLYDAAAFACDGKLLGVVCKQNLAGDGIHYEPRWFLRWAAGAVAAIELCGATVPLGDLVFDVGGVRIGFEICEDAWVADRPAGRLARRDVDVILNPSASHFAFDKQKVRKRFVLEGSRKFHVSYVYANLLGNEAGRAIYDGGSMIASGGQMLAQAKRFSFTDWQLITAVVDVDATRLQRARTSTAHYETATLGGKTISVEYELPRARLLAAMPSASVSTNDSLCETGSSAKEEEFAHVVALALFDYLRKSRSGGFVVSLSGGADSSAVALLVWLTVKFGVAELGREGFLSKLDHISALREEPRLLDQLLTCVYQSTQNSTATTHDAAQAVAEAIGAKFLTLDVDDLVEGYKSIIADVIGRELSWNTDDLALQNIQARVRGPSVWLLANLRGSLLLTTSNRSEAAVGYATMDGDTCGGLAPIAGIDKAFLRHWLRWMESTGPVGVGPLPALSAVNEQQPTAELRPPTAGQTDEDDLMPYDVLDVIERAAIRDKLVPTEVLQVVRQKFPRHSPRQLGRWIERFFRLWCRNQWKRERYAPSFHLDDENLDPKTWCRFPILSGGYERELAKLRESLDSKDGTA